MYCSVLGCGNYDTSAPNIRAFFQNNALNFVLYCGRVQAANSRGCTATEGLLYKPWSLVVPTCTARDPISERRNYLGEKWPMNFA